MPLYLGYLNRVQEHYNWVLITNLGLGNADVLATNRSRAMKHRCVWGGTSNFAKSTSI